MYYTPLIATQFGLDEVAAYCSDLNVCPAHVLNEEYSLISKRSTLWPSTLMARAPEFLFEASRRAGIVRQLGPDWSGLRNLALPLAFFHCVPDATLPLYYWDDNGWTPLIRRR